MNNFKNLLIIAFILAVAIGCKVKKDVIVQVDKDVVSSADFKGRMQEAADYYNKDYVQTEQGKTQVLDGVVKETVMLFAARDKGFDKTEEYKTQLSNFTRQALITSLVKDLREKELQVKDEEVKAVYDKDKAYYDNPVQVEVSHILVLDKAKAESLLKEPQAGADFAVLASSASIDQSSAANGGKLNWLGKDDMVPVFENAAFALVNNGDISGIVQTPFGYHIIKKLNQNDGAC